MHKYTDFPGAMSKGYKAYFYPGDIDSFGRIHEWSSKEITSPLTNKASKSVYALGSMNYN